jgi:hypothetical protein
LIRTKPRREDSSREEEERAVTETEETEMVTWPLGVKPNFSKKIMGAGVGLHGERFDFCGGGEEEEEGNVGFPHCNFWWWW